MTKFEVFVIAVFLKTLITAFSESTDTVTFHQTNKILDVLDDIFIALKINRNVSKLKNIEDMAKHSLIQDTLYKSHIKYKEILDICKTDINNKIDYYLSNINDVIDEMISKEIETNHEKVEFDSTLSESQDFLNLTRRFNLNIKVLDLPLPKKKLPNTKTSKDEARRIFQGSSTGIKRYPFMVSVHVAGHFLCSGSLVHESLALSAGSCLMRTSDLNAHIQIRVASNYVSRMGYLINIDELFFHPEFDRKTLTNNLVLLKTRKALRFRKQRVVAIQYDRAPSALKPDVENVIILGWGRRKTDEADRPQEETPLSEATVEVYDFDSCQYIYTEEFVTNKTFCAGFGAGACNHDAGGPALLDNVLVGVISFGSPHCGATEAPTVFTRVGLYHQWIEDVFQKITQNPEVRSETNKQMNDDDYVKNQILDVDEAMKDIYRENFNVDDVLYGPIEALDENDNPIVVNQSVLRNFQNDLSLFPDPEFLALLPQPETPKPELPDEYWRDEPSNEQTNTTNEETTTTNEQTTTTNEQTTTTYEETTTTYEETTTAYKEATTTYEEITTTSEQTTTTSDNYELEEEEDQFLAIEVTHTTNLPQVTQDVKSSLRIGTTESSQSEIYNDNKFNDIKTSEEDCAIRYRLCKKRKKAKASDNIRENVNEFDSDSNNVLVNPRRDQLEPKPPKPKIDADEDDDMAVIVLLDSFTTQRIEVHKNDPVYERGFKVLATKVLQAQELV